VDGGAADLDGCDGHDRPCGECEVCPPDAPQGDRVVGLSGEPDEVAVPLDDRRRTRDGLFCPGFFLGAAELNPQVGCELLDGHQQNQSSSPERPAVISRRSRASLLRRSAFRPLTASYSARSASRSPPLVASPPASSGLVDGSGCSSWVSSTTNSPRSTLLLNVRSSSPGAGISRVHTSPLRDRNVTRTSDHPSPLPLPLPLPASGSTTTSAAARPVGRVTSAP